MAENLNIFGKNQEEIGSLDKNLVLRTKGRVYIRFGRKYIELIDDKGNINVKIPKVLTKVNSEDEMKSNGFYLLDGNLYIYNDGEITLITGVEGLFISYAIEQNLTQDQINIAQKNIGLKFNSLKDAQKIISEGIVFIGDKLFYINGKDSTELFVLNNPLSSINSSDIGMPLKDNVCIGWNKNKWEYLPVVSPTDLKNAISSSLKSENSDEDTITYDYVLYSKYYKIIKQELIINTTTGTEELFITGLEGLKTIPAFDLKNDDLGIISIPVYVLGVCETYNNGGKQYIVAVSSSEKEGIEKDILVLNLIVDNGRLLFINKKGQQLLLDLTKGKLFESTSKYKENGSFSFDKYKEGQEIYIIKYENKYWGADIEGFLKNVNIYIKAEDSNSKKFKIDYQHAEIALEENYPKYPKDSEDGDVLITPHTVLGDLDDKSEYYNSPAKSFRTYKEKENTQGLYSDLAVFNGAEFRGTYPEEKANEEVYSFPRYSKKLNKDLCENHAQSSIQENDPFENVIPSIKWIKSAQEGSLNEPLKSINSQASPDLKTLPTGNNQCITRMESHWEYKEMTSKSDFDTAINEINEKIDEISGGDVDIDLILTDGVEIAKINGTSIYAPEGGGGGDPGESVLRQITEIKNNIYKIEGDITVLRSQIKMFEPKGIIQMWSGSLNTVPVGWAVCDGKNGTPDLRDRFIVGAGNEYNVNTIGGKKEVTLDSTLIPAHNHKVKDYYYIEAQSTINEGRNLIYGGYEFIGGTKEYLGSGGSDDDNRALLYYEHNSENNTGGGQAHENRPPYYSLYYIMKLDECVISLTMNITDIENNTKIYSGTNSEIMSIGQSSSTMSDLPAKGLYKFTLTGTWYVNLMPKTKTGIGTYTNCTAITSVSINNSITTVYSTTFNGCSSLTTVTLPESLTNLNWGGFSECNSLLTVNIKAKETDITFTGTKPSGVTVNYI